jgi:hypothetical protein
MGKRASGTKLPIYRNINECTKLPATDRRNKPAQT